MNFDIFASLLLPLKSTHLVTFDPFDNVVFLSPSVLLPNIHNLESPTTEGIFCGTSSGMNVAAAIQISKELGPLSRVVTVACDTGLKYLSEGLFD